MKNIKHFSKFFANFHFLTIIIQFQISDIRWNPILLNIWMKMFRGFFVWATYRYYIRQIDRDFINFDILSFPSHKLFDKDTKWNYIFCWMFWSILCHFFAQFLYRFEPNFMSFSKNLEVFVKIVWRFFLFYPISWFNSGCQTSLSPSAFFVCTIDIHNHQNLMKC